MQATEPKALDTPLERVSLPDRPRCEGAAALVPPA
jgi:hypothetical protein